MASDVGPSAVMGNLLKKFVLAAGTPLWRLLGWIVPKDRAHIAINAFPDFDDSTRAVAVALRGTGRKLSILTTQKDVARPAWLNASDAVLAYRYSARGIWLYHRAKYVLFTHGCFSAWTPASRQVVVNIWHGMPIKRIGLLDGKRREELPRFHYTIASDERFQAIMSAAFGVERERVLVAEHPRLDLLRGTPDRRAMGLADHERLVVWLPTYRASVTGDVRVDGDASADIFSGAVDLTPIDALFGRHDVRCIVKPHPMARVDRDLFARYRSLTLLDDKALASRGVSLYELLAMSDVLVTDVSSVYFDYKVLGRPVILYCPDLREYAATRGFVAPIETLVTHEIVETESALAAKLEACFSAPRSAPRESYGGSAAAGLLHQIGAV